MGIPQIIVIILISLGLVSTLFLHGREKPIEHQYYNFYYTLLNDVMTICLLIWGGFFI